MTFQEIIDTYLAGGITAVIGALILVEISSKKFKPLSWLAKKVGKAMNAEVLTRVDNIDKKLDAHIKENEEKEARSCRNRILRFADELYQNIDHSKEMFDAVLLDVTAYEKYCADHEKFQNSVAEMSIKYIKDTYARLLENHKFL